MKIEEAQKKLNNRFPLENLQIISFEGLAKGFCTIKCNNCDWKQDFARFSDVLKKSKKTVCQKCAKHNRIKQHFIQSVRDRIPDEPFELHNFTTTQNQCDVECLQCHNIVHYVRASALLNKKHICAKCNPLRYKELQSKIKEFKNFIDCSEKWELITDLNTITSSQEKIECRCLICNEINSKTMYDYLRNIGCPCGRRGDIQNQLKRVCGTDYKIIKIAKTVRQRVTLQHRCGFVYSVNSRNFLEGGGQCPKCCKNNSKGEQRIKNFLDSQKIEYEKEFPIKIQGHLLRFDFYLPQYDLYIEYQGKQHYQVIDYWGGEEGYQKRVLYDNLKKEYCKNKLLEIKHTDYDNIEKILTTRFNDYPEKE